IRIEVSPASSKKAEITPGVSRNSRSRTVIPDPLEAPGFELGSIACTFTHGEANSARSKASPDSTGNPEKSGSGDERTCRSPSRMTNMLSHATHRRPPLIDSTRPARGVIMKGRDIDARHHAGITWT